MQVWENLTAATMQPGGAPYGLIEDAAILVRDGRIAFVGPRAECPRKPGAEPRDAGGALATPGLIDCHTHLVYGGNRAREFEMRLQGAAYEDIARAGGGILSTVRATRALDEPALVAASLPRLDALLAEGVTTVEIKSGYGLDTQSELRMLRAARRLGQERAVDIRTSFLGAHATPPEFAGNADGYIDLLCRETLPMAVEDGLVDAVDAFCEGIAFSVPQVRRLLTVARDLGLPLKVHAEQLSNLGGAALAAEFGALSADHLEHLDEAGVAAMAQAGTVAVLLPGAYYMLRETKAPPVGLLRGHGVPIALATDANPGTSPITSPLLILNMGCTLFRLTPEEALAGFTRIAARALGLSDRGILAPGLRADIAFWRVAQPAELAYAVGLHRPARVLVAGAARIHHGASA